MVFAASSAMWLYCTGTVFGGKGRLLSTQKERDSEREGASMESQKSIEGKNEVESFERQEKEGEAKKDE